MKCLKTDFAKVHLVLLVFGLINVGLGFAMKFGLVPYAAAIEIHEFTGFALVPIILLVPLLFRRRTQIYKAFKAKFLISKRDLAQKKPLMLTAKVVTNLMALGFLSQLTTALLMKTGLGYRWFPGANIYGFHTTFVYILPALVVLHAVLMWLAHRSKPKKAAS